MRRVLFLSLLLLAPALSFALDAPSAGTDRDAGAPPDEASADADVNGPGTRSAAVSSGLDSRSTWDSKAPGGIDYAAPGGDGYAAPGSDRYDGPGGNRNDAPGGPCYSGPGGACYVAPGGVSASCPSFCR